MSLPGTANSGPSLDGLRRALAADQTFARVRAEAARGFAVRGEDYQISSPAGLRAVLLAEMADGLTAAHAGNSGGVRDVQSNVRHWGRQVGFLVHQLRIMNAQACGSLTCRA